MTIHMKIREGYGPTAEIAVFSITDGKPKLLERVKTKSCNIMQAAELLAQKLRDEHQVTIIDKIHVVGVGPNNALRGILKYFSVDPLNTSNSEVKEIYTPRQP